MCTTTRLAVAINLYHLTLLFADHVMLPLRTVSFGFPAIHVHIMPTALMNKQKANSLANIAWLELGK